MRFLKTLQRKQFEQPLDQETLDNVVSPDKVTEERISSPPELPLIQDSRPERPAATVAAQFDNPNGYVAEPPPLSAAEKTENGAAQEARLVRPVILAENSSKFSAAALSVSAVETIEIDSSRVNSRLVAITEPASAYSEEYRNLRTQVLHKSQRQKLKSIVITSTGLSEGKSVTSLNLSWLLAQTDGVKALVIDGDLRRPSLAQYLGIATKMGLSTILDGESPLSEAIVQLNPSGLYLLAGGEARDDVAEQISGQKFKELISQIRDKFDFVIIDAPPLGMFADASVLVNHADGAILVVRANQTNYKDVERVLEMLPREKMIGAVLNQSEDTLISDNYYHRYYSSNRI